jgi:hypothetical protein
MLVLSLNIGVRTNIPLQAELPKQDYFATYLRIMPPDRRMPEKWH